LNIAEKYFAVNFSGNALDFGCGVGRVVCGLADRFSKVVGVDISEGMIATARRDAQERGKNNVTFDLTSAPMVMEPEQYDFVHTFIVLQHIPITEGEKIVGRLIAALKPGGVGAVHLTYDNPYGWILTKLRYVVKETMFLRGLSNLVRKRPWAYPTFQMNLYSLPKILQILSSARIDEFVTHLVDDWGHRGVFLFFQKPLDGRDGSPWANPIHPRQ
jgi:2-polyprenyl-3-methyl-5-hydroxy-6-metoxy-1,4-benzoquinol methylase